MDFDSVAFATVTAEVVRDGPLRPPQKLEPIVEASAQTIGEFFEEWFPGCDINAD